MARLPTGRSSAAAPPDVPGASGAAAGGADMLELLDLLPDGIAVQEAGVIVYANAALARMTGTADAAALIGCGLPELVTEEYLEAERERAQRRASVPQGGAVFSERRLRQPDGGSLDVEIATVSIGGQGDRRQQVIVRDISERKRQEARVLQINAELEARVAERTAELKAAVDEVESITYTIAHDLKAPLRAIDGFSRLIEGAAGHALIGESGRHFARIRENAHRMAALIDDLLDFARLGRRALEHGAVDLEELVHDVAANLAPSWPQAGIEVGPMPQVTGDRVLLWRVFANLLGNALKFSARGPVPKVRVTAAAADGEVTVCVADNGVGFDMGHAQKLFGVFQRLHAAREFEGTGIGLATVKRIVERHGGRVWADARPGAGAQFYAVFPLAGANRPQDGPPVPVSREKGGSRP